MNPNYDDNVDNRVKGMVKHCCYVWEHMVM